MDKFKRIVFEYWIKNKLIEKEEKDWLSYRWDIIEGKICNVLIVFIFCILFSNDIRFITYVVAYSFLKQWTNGFHCTGKQTCLVMSILWYVFIECLLSANIYENDMLFIITDIVGIVLVGKYAPFNHVRVQLSSEEYKNNRIKTIITLVVEEIIVVVILYLKCELWKSVSFGIFTCAVFVILGKITNQEVKYE